MPKYIRRFIGFILLVFCFVFLVFLLNSIVGLAQFAGNFDQRLQPVVFFGLLGLLSLALVWLCFLVLIRPKAILLPSNPSEAEVIRYRKQLYKRLAKNRVLKEAGFSLKDETSLPEALDILGVEANTRIKKTAKRVFLGTAASQNGRLDAFIVFFLIARLVYDLSCLYNQRPHWRELLNLYANVAGTAFMAGAVEELGLDEYLGQMMAPVVGSSAIGAMPGAVALSTVIASSLLDGSTNALLTLRCGVIARNYLCLSLDGGESMRKKATLEASRMFLDISGSCVSTVSKLLIKGAGSAVEAGGKAAVSRVGNVIGSTADSLSQGVQGLGSSVASTAGVIAGGAGKTVDGVKKGAGFIGSGAGLVKSSLRKGQSRLKGSSKKTK